MSAKTIRAPRNAKAFAVDTKVKEGTMTSSPGWMSSSRAHISSACVQDVVTIALGTPSVCSKKRMAPFGVSLIPGNLADGHRPEDMFQFPPLERRVS